jgi:uncharacterized surface protein with fasciclin (FAS1) repeats
VKSSAWIIVSAGCALGLSGAALARQGAQPKPADAVKSAQAQMDVVDVAVAAGNFKTLAAALKAAGLIDTFKGKGPFTVFAPTDEAFAKLPPGTVESLLMPENKDKLIAVLTYHVVPGAVPASQVVGMKNATTVNGQRVDIMVKDGKVVLDKTATVTKADVKASNGVIHVIDTVILPSDKNIVDTAVAAGSFTTLAKALQAAGLVDALKGKGPFTVFAPTDEAFAKLPPGTLEALLKPENKEKLAAILKYHVIPGAVYADQAVKLDKSPNTLQGTPFSISVKDGQVAIGNSGGMANVVATDIETSNGVIHVIDAVILPK